MNILTPIITMTEKEKSEVTPGDLDQIFEFFEEASVSQGIKFVLQEAELPDGTYISRYESLVASKFYDRDENLWLTTKDGLSVNISEMVATAKNML